MHFSPIGVSARQKVNEVGAAFISAAFASVLAKEKGKLAKLRSSLHIDSPCRGMSVTVHSARRRERNFYTLFFG